MWQLVGSQLPTGSCSLSGASPCQGFCVMSARRQLKPQQAARLLAPGADSGGSDSLTPSAASASNNFQHPHTHAFRGSINLASELGSKTGGLRFLTKVLQLPLAGFACANADADSACYKHAPGSSTCAQLSMDPTREGMYRGRASHESMQLVHSREQGAMGRRLESMHAKPCGSPCNAAQQLT